MTAARHRRTCPLFGLAAALALLFLPSYAEKLPIRSYTTLDGLADDGVRHVLADSRGFIWFCTREGLFALEQKDSSSSWEARRLSVSEGLVSESTTSVARDSQGNLWIGTISVVLALGPAFSFDLRHLAARGVGLDFAVFTHVAQRGGCEDQSRKRQSRGCPFHRHTSHATKGDQASPGYGDSSPGGAAVEQAAPGCPALG